MVESTMVTRMDRLQDISHPSLRRFAPVAVTTCPSLRRFAPILIGRFAH